MARETRFSNTTIATTTNIPLAPASALDANTLDTSTPSSMQDDTGSKRKRRGSSPSIITSTLKIIWPSSASVSASTEIVPESRTEETTANGHDNKRARMDVDGEGGGEGEQTNGGAVGKENEINQVSDTVRKNGKHEEFTEEVLLTSKATASSSRPERILNSHTREALASVLAEMSANLPAPINSILTLHLPPSFEESPENTLGHILNSADLTWESLIDTLHLLSQQLLLPCAYPNPFPSRSRIHLPAPPLPSHYPPLSVYTFCESLHALLLSIEPGSNQVGEDPQGERWALMQKTAPGVAGAGGEWFTSAADLEAVESKGGLDALIENDKLGYASPISLHTTVPRSAPPKLVESVMRRASLKSHRWKEQRLSRRFGQGFGSISRPVDAVRTTSSSISWTPSFAPSFDSTRSCGGGFDRTTSTIHSHAVVGRWLKGWKQDGDDLTGEGFSEVIDAEAQDKDEVSAGHVYVEEDDGKEKIAIDEETKGKRKEKGKGKSTVHLNVGDKLKENAELIAELQSWQSVRIWKGDVKPSYRENLVAEQLLSNLSDLATSSKPSALLSSPDTFSAQTSSSRLLATSSPAIRGTLDPRRPHALHDNSTLRLGAHAIALAAAAAAKNASVPGQIHAPPPATLGLGIAGPSGTLPSAAGRASVPNPVGTGFVGAQVAAGGMGMMAPPPAPQIREPPPHTLPPGARHQMPGMMSVGSGVGMGLGMGKPMHGFNTGGSRPGYAGVGQMTYPPQGGSNSRMPSTIHLGLAGPSSASSGYRQQQQQQQQQNAMRSGQQPASPSPSPSATLGKQQQQSEQQAHAQQVQINRPGPGPSGLRQSYGP